MNAVTALFEKVIYEGAGLVECSECGEEVPQDEVVYCQDCGVPLCPQCGVLGFCSNCAEVWEAEEDLELEEEGW